MKKSDILNFLIVCLFFFLLDNKVEKNQSTLVRDKDNPQKYKTKGKEEYYSLIWFTRLEASTFQCNKKFSVPIFQKLELIECSK